LMGGALKQIGASESNHPELAFFQALWQAVDKIDGRVWPDA